jgi:beta-glucosidase
MTPAVDRRELLKWVATSAGGALAAKASMSAAGAAPAVLAAKSPPGFPDDFVWGAATAAYQVEGAAAEGGRGPCIWDMFCRRPGKIWRDQCADVSADHYHHMKEDVALMKAMGLPAYRFSISWSRVLPEGTGTPNTAGLDFYDRLVDELLGAGIAPWATLYHWDLPVGIYHRGGFMNRDVADWFGDYTTLVARKLSDRVPGWMPLNEPQVFIGSGLQLGRHAPGDQLAFGEVMLAAHNTLRCHGRAVQALRAAARGSLPLQIGTAQAGVNRIPATARPEDEKAARERALATDPETMYSNTLWLDPMVLSRYPEDYLKGNAKHAPRLFGTSIFADDLRVIGQPLDFIGINQYQADRVRFVPGGRAAVSDKAGDKSENKTGGKTETVPWPDGFPITASFEWAVAPETMYYMPKFIYERYRKPIYITENGISVRDWVSVDGKCHDPMRIDFTVRYLRQLARAIAEGIPVRGYFHWSLLDNYEWAEGFKHRFGLIHVDYQTGKRTLKDSAYWYRDVVRSRGKLVMAALPSSP